MLEKLLIIHVEKLVSSLQCKVPSARVCAYVRAYLHVETYGDFKNTVLCNAALTKFYTLTLTLLT